jgi:hypothetical protein
MSSATQSVPKEKENGACLDVAEFRRLKYFYGQMLGAQDMQTEQNFFREKMKLHNRCLHGYGVVCGLFVEPVPLPKECNTEEEEEEDKLRHCLDDLVKQKGQPAAPADLDAQIAKAQLDLDNFYKEHCKEEPRSRIRINCGLALDCDGNELIVRHPLTVDLLQTLSAADYKRVLQGAETLYVSLCYCERPVDPVRPVLSNACSATSDCTYSKLQDCVRVQVTVDPPACDERCETCCECCEQACLLLARICEFRPGHPWHEWQIDNHVRRPLSRYVLTTIKEISWRHGHSYTQEEAKLLMGTDHDDDDPDDLKGLEIRFSRPVLTSTIRRGVIDTWVMEGGSGRSGNIYHKKGVLGLPDTEYTDRVFYRDATGETLEPGDRVLIIVRADFILDHCCRPVDGEHVGGRVPQIEEYAEDFGEYPEPEHCCIPPVGYKPWTSGNGDPGGTFESWFYIKEREKEHGKGSREGVR